MANDGSGAYLLVWLVTVVPAAVASFPLESRRRAKAPATLPYTWGYFIGLQTLCYGVLTGLAAVLFALAGDTPVRGVLFLVIVAALYGTPGYYVLRRRRWAWVAATLLSLNVVWWIANAIYGKNRWREFGSSAPPGPGTASVSSEVASS